MIMGVGLGRRMEASPDRAAAIFSSADSLLACTHAFHDSAPKNHNQVQCSRSTLRPKSKSM